MSEEEKPIEENSVEINESQDNIAGSQQPQENSQGQQSQEDNQYPPPPPDLENRLTSESYTHRSDHSQENVNDQEDDEFKHKREKPEKKILPTDMYYEYPEMVSKPIVTDESGLPIDVIKFTHSAGYDCHKRDNLILLDQNRLCFISGNFIEFFDMNDGSQFLLRSLSGDGIGCINIHPSKKYLAVGEKNAKECPFVAIYEIETLRLYRLLREGTEKAYAYCQFNTTGELLATVGSDPDYMLTLWEWENEQIVLRSKAFSQDVYRVSWSNDLEGILTTAGAGHIKFWKMADTFTGLKLQGHIGKFGKTEISDIEGYVILPDGKVLSGCEWGNMLVWDGDLIKVQIGRKKKPCHMNEISQIIIEEGELMTIGRDGWIKTWDFETIDTAEVSEEMAIFEMEPMNEVSVSADAKLMHIVKSTDPESSIWFAQDANGKIWKLDLSFSHTSTAPQIVSTFHSGSIMDCDVSPLAYMSASIGEDGSVRVYDFATHTLLAENKYPSLGCKILWSSLKIDPKGKMIIAGFHDGVIRIIYFTEALETDISKKSKFKGELSLIQALKPHTKPLSALCTDDKGRILITGSEDGTVFFFSISQPEFYPLGFVNLNKPVRYIEWKMSKKENSDEEMGRIVVYLDEGDVVEVVCPSPDKVDHSLTYEIQEIVPINTYKFVSIKSKLRHEEELERKRKEEEERQKMLAQQRKERLERGLETEEEQQKQIEEEEKRIAAEKEKDEEWVPHIPDVPSPILFGFSDKKDSNKFWLSMDEFDAGYLYQCEFATKEKINKLRIPEKYNEAVSSPGLFDSNDVPVTCLKWSKSGLRALMGLKNGTIRLQIVEEAFNLKTMSSCWQFTMHDTDYGHINSICFSYDERFIISVGRDGNYFVYELMDEALQKEQIDDYRARLPSASLPIAKETVEDIDDPKAYSIEEHKQKSEYDRRVKLAQKKKEDTLKHIAELQKQFKILKDKNNALPDRIKFSEAAFELVPQLRADLAKIREDKIDLVHKQMAFDAEKCRILLNKLHKKFIESIESDHIEVHAIESSHTVCTIRGCVLSEEYYKVVQELETKRLEMQKRDLSRDPTVHDKGLLGEDERDGEKKQDDGLLSYDLKGARGMRVARQLKKLEENKKKRSLRKAQWDALYARKPKENYEDPRDIAAIEEAKEKMGDFKLKSSDDYFVSEKDRPTTFKAQLELVASENYLFEERSRFNEKVKDLINVKKRIIRLVDDTNKQIQECNSLQIKSRKNLLPEVILHPSENPEKKFEYTESTLWEFKKELEERKKAALQGEDHNKTGFSTFTKPPVIESKPGTRVQRTTAAAQDSSGLDHSEGHASMSVVAPSLSYLQKERAHISQLRTICKTDKMIEETLHQIRVFDMKLKLLRQERTKLSLILKRGLLRQLTLFEEYRLLKLYEKSELTLTMKAEAKMDEKSEISNKITEFQIKIDLKRKDIEKLNDKIRINFLKFKESLGENNKFEDYLTKVFKKKIKRRKKETEGNDDESDDSSDSDDSDLDDSEENSDEDSVVYDLDMCPPNCPTELYDGTCLLREINLDFEEELAEEKRQQENLKKELENFTKKLKIVENGLQQAKKELEAFQLEKQQKLNVLKTCVILTTQQILYHEGGQLPPSLDPILVFEAGNYRQLKVRIKQLHDEETAQKKLGKEVKSRHARLHKNKKLFQKKISDTQFECNEMMKSKFGKLDNLEKMEQVMINPKIEELTFKMLQLQEDNYLEHSSWEDRIREAQELCIGETKTNTCILNNMLSLYNEKEAYEEKLDSKQKDLGTEYQLTGPKAEEEIAKLNQLVQIQAQELEALKEEISMLSRKGGHILPPVAASTSSNLYGGGPMQSHFNDNDLYAGGGMDMGQLSGDEEGEEEEEEEDAGGIDWKNNDNVAVVN